MEYSLAYYTGWAIAIVLMFIVPLLIAWIYHARSISRELRAINAKLSPVDEPDNVEVLK